MDCYGIFWEGSHYDHMRDFIQTLQKEGRGTGVKLI